MSEVLHHAVPRDSVKECSDGSALHIVFLRIVHQSHEHVLHNLFRGPDVSGHAHREAVHGHLVPAVEERESFLITSGGPPQKNVVSLLLSDPHLSRYDVLCVLDYLFPPPSQKVPAWLRLPQRRIGSYCLRTRLDAEQGYRVSTEEYNFKLGLCLRNGGTAFGRREIALLFFVRLEHSGSNLGYEAPGHETFSVRA